MRADRLVATLLLLQARGRVTARELAEELEVSEKTARRDLEALGQAGIPVYSQPGRNGGWQLLGGGRTDLTGFTADEARTLFLALGASVGATGGASAGVASALRKLARALPETFRADAEVAASAVVVDPSAWGGVPPAAPPRHLPALQQAVIERRRVVLGYVDRTQRVSERPVDPLGLVSKGSIWYLVARTDAGMRTFRVGRVRSVELTDVVVERPKGFDLDAAWQQVLANVAEFRRQVRATVLIPATHVRWLRFQFGGDVLVAEVDGPGPDGRVEVIVAGGSTLDVAQMLAGWGAAVEVIEPAEVRAELARIGRELVDRYGRAQ